MPCCGNVYDKQICLQALSRAMDLRPLHNQIGQELQEAKAHLTLEQINEVITTPVQTQSASLHSRVLCPCSICGFLTHNTAFTA